MSTGQIVLGVVGAIVGYFTGGAGWYLVGAMMMGAAAGVAVGGMLDPTESDVAAPGTPQTQPLDVPTIEEGVAMGDIVGTTRVVGQIFWYGNGRSEPIIEKSKSQGKGGGSKTTKPVVGYNYHLSWAQGLCLGPVETLHTVLNDEDVVWSGELNAPATGGKETISLEGMGSMTLYFGNGDHSANSQIGDAVGDIVNPSYPDLCWAFFDDCIIGQFNRAPRMRFLMKKRPTYSFSDLESIGDWDYNPAHLIYHILTSPNYAGFPTDWINIPSFAAFSSLMDTENHGLSMLLLKQDSALKLVENVLIHVSAIMKYGVDGKFHLFALRDSTPIMSLPEITQDDFLEPMVLMRKGWPEVVNEMQIQHHLRYNLREGEVPGEFVQNDTFDGDDGDPLSEKWEYLYPTSGFPDWGPPDPWEPEAPQIKEDPFTFSSSMYMPISATAGVPRLRTACNFDFEYDFDVRFYMALENPHEIGFAKNSFSYEFGWSYGGTARIWIYWRYKNSGLYWEIYTISVNPPPAYSVEWNAHEGGFPYGDYRITWEHDTATIRMYRWGYPLGGWNLLHEHAGLWGFAWRQTAMYLEGESKAPNYPDMGFFMDNFAYVGVLDACPEVVVPYELNIRRAAVTAEDRGSPEIHGRSITKSKQLMMFGSQENANWAAERAIRRSAYPFVEGQMILNRYGFEYEVGDLFRLSDSEHNISDMACRVMQISEGKLDSETVEVDWSEEPDYVTSSATLALITETGRVRDTDLEPLENVDIIEAPYFLVGENIKILPLAGRKKGTEIGYELWASIDGGASYKFADNISYYAVHGSLVDELSVDVLTLDKVTGFEVDFSNLVDAADIQTITRTQLFSNENMALLGDEILNFETITPDGVIDGRYKIESLNRARFDSVRKTWPGGTDFWFLGTQAIQPVSNPAFLKGSTLKFKMVPYNEVFVGDIADATEIEITLVGRGKAPYVPANLNASGRSQNPTYGKNIYLTWDPRRRGYGAGTLNPDEIVDSAPTHEGHFKIEVRDSLDALVRTVSELDVYAWTYTSAMNIADNGGLESPLTFKLDNYRVSGVTYTNIHSGEIGVTLVSSTTTTTTTTTT